LKDYFDEQRSLLPATIRENVRSFLIPKDLL